MSQRYAIQLSFPRAPWLGSPACRCRGSPRSHVGQHSPHNMGQVDGAACCKVTCLRCPASIQRTLVLPAYMVHEYVHYVHSTRVCVHIQCKRTLQAAAEPATRRSCWQPTRAKLQSAGAQARLPPRTQLASRVSLHICSQRPGRPRLAAVPSRARAQPRPQRAGTGVPGLPARRAGRAARTRAQRQGRAAGCPAARALTAAARAGSAGSGGPARGGPRAAPSSRRPRTRPARPGRRRARVRSQSRCRPARGAFQPAPTYTPGPTCALAR